MMHRTLDPHPNLARRWCAAALTALALACDPAVGGDVDPLAAADEPDEAAGESSPDEPGVAAIGLASPGTSSASTTEPPTHGGHPVDVGECGTQPNCVDDIPMSGNVSPLFAEVDHAMRAYMKSQCVGAGVLSVSYNGRRVYKRGFGRMHGSSMAEPPAHCGFDVFEDGDVVLPDTAVNVGSVSKLLPGMMVRDLVQARIDFVEAKGIVPVGTYPDPTAVLLLDPVLQLLPPSLLKLFDQTRADAECPPLAITDTFGCMRAAGCSGTGPDLRWQNVTVGDLLAHTSGLPTSGPQLLGTIAELDVLRGLDTWGDYFLEDAAVKSTATSPAALESARDYLAKEAGVDGDDVFFVNPWDLLAGIDTHPIDESLVRLAGRCLQSSPGGQSDTNANGGTFRYSNTGYVLLERIVTHLHAAPRFTSMEGTTEANTALDEFLTDNGLEEGVRNRYAMFPRRKYGPGDPGGPDRREFDATQLTYTPLRTSFQRPFCVWDGAACQFDLWLDGSPANDRFRLPSDFAISGLMFDPVSGAVVPTNAPPLVPFERQTPVLAAGTGQLAMEAPALLQLMGTFFVGNNDVRTGRRLANCTNCNTAAWKNGIAGGTRAIATSLVGGTASSVLPPRDGSGRLTVEPSPGQWTNVTWTDANNVDFVVSIHQSGDESGGGQLYAQVEHAVRYGLSRVDWNAVDRMVERQRLNVVGMGIASTGNAYYWYEDGHRIWQPGLPAGHHVIPEPTPVVPPGDPGGPTAYALPSTRNGSDVVAVAIANNNRVYGWYDDGHRSAGTSWDLGATVPTHTYTVPTGYTYNDIVGVAISSGNTTWSWFNDGWVGRGTSWALGSKSMHQYELPPGQTHDQIVAMALNKANDHTFTLFKDGSVAEGDFYDLDCWGYTRGGIAGMGMRGGNTSVWYRNGYRKDLIGSPADNQEDPQIASTSDYYLLPDGYAHDEIIGVALPNLLGARMWFDDGARASVAADGNFVLAGAAGSVTFPIGAGANLIQGVAMSGFSSTYSWTNTGTWANGIPGDLASVGQWAGFATPGGQSEFSVEAVAIDTGAGGDGKTWTIFSDGAVSRGWAWDLDVDYWPAPVVPH